MSYARLAVPVALGLSLVTVSAVVAYYLLKKEDGAGRKKSLKTSTSRVNLVEINVPKSIVPALIGRGGSNIKDLEKKTGALIHFKKFSDKDYDVCIIRGRRDATVLAETYVHDFIRNQPIIEEETITVPSWACGRIIGTGGDTITDMSHRSGARIRVDGAQLGDTRNVALRGTREQCAAARALVENCVAQEKCRREIEQCKRAPRRSEAAPPSPPAADPAGDTAKHVVTKASGATIEVYVSAVSSPARFWVQLVGPQVAQLDALVAQMTDYYGDKDNRRGHQLSSVSVGQVVAAVFRHDGRWYRARVVDLRPNEFDPTKQVADVFFLDYGDSEYVAVHELCELRADLLRFRFQAMECYLSGVRAPAAAAAAEPGNDAAAGNGTDAAAAPGNGSDAGAGPGAGTDAGAEWEHWPQHAVERFEELTQVARWKPLVSRMCSFRRVGDGDRDREIPGIKLYDVTDDGEIDIGATLVAEGCARAASPAPASPRASPRASPAPFGDLGASRVLGMLGGGGGGGGGGARGERAASQPRDEPHDSHAGDPQMASSQSLGSGMEAHRLNGADFTRAERDQLAREAPAPAGQAPAPRREDLKANMNRIDSHHGNLEALGRTH